MQFEIEDSFKIKIDQIIAKDLQELFGDDAGIFVILLNFERTLLDAKHTKQRMEKASTDKITHCTYKESLQRKIMCKTSENFRSLSDPF